MPERNAAGERVVPVKTLVRTIHGEHMDPRLAHLINHPLFDHPLSADGIRAANALFPVLLFPAFKVQNIMQRRFMGDKLVKQVTITRHLLGLAVNHDGMIGLNSS